MRYSLIGCFSIAMDSLEAQMIESNEGPIYIARDHGSSPLILLT